MLLFRFILFFAVVFCQKALLAGPIELGTFSKFSQSFCNFHITSNDAEQGSLFRRALSLHGGMRETSLPEATCAINIDKKADQLNVNITLKGGKTYAYSVKSASSSASSLRACDFILKKIWNAQGFLSGKLVFVASKTGFPEIYTSDMLFESVLQITNDKSAVVMPRWHPDANQIIYTTYFKTGFPDIYSINISTKQYANIASYKGTNTAPCYSPSGKSLAMVLSPSKTPQIYFADVNGKNLQKITNSTGIKTLPVFSKDEKTLYFCWDNGTSKPQLHKMDVKSRTIHRIATNLSNYIDEVDVHPFEDRLLFTAAIGKTFQICTYSFATNKSEILTDGQLDHIEGKWLPDGRHILCTERSTSKRTLVLFDTQNKKYSKLNCEFLKNTYQSDYIYIQR